MDANKSFYRKLWKMQVPPKVKIFWRRVIKAYIPCRGVLKGIHIEKLPFCKSCGRNETIKHALFECTWEKLFWNEIQVATSVKLLVLHPDSWAMDLVGSKRLSLAEAAVILCGCWVVWSERNARDHDEHTRTVAQSLLRTSPSQVDMCLLDYRELLLDGNPRRRAF